MHDRLVLHIGMVYPNAVVSASSQLPLLEVDHILWTYLNISRDALEEMTHIVTRSRRVEVFETSSVLISFEELDLVSVYPS